jgi:hypothetical protein
MKVNVALMWIGLGVAGGMCGPTSLAEAWQSGLGERQSGLDSSLTPGYAQRTMVGDFKQDVEALDQDVSPAAATAEAGADRASEEIAWEPGRSPFTFHSAFGHAVQYDSNLFNAAFDPEGDVIESPTVSVGVTAGRAELSRQYFETFYDVSYLDYAEHDKLDQWSHLHYTRYDWRGPKLRFNFENHFRPFAPRDAGDRRELSVSGLVAAVTAVSNEARLKTFYELTPKLKFSNVWKHEVFYFPNGIRSNTRAAELLSYQMHTVAPRLTYDLTAKTGLFTEYQVQTADYIKDGVFAFKTHAVQTGFLTQLDPKTSFLFQAGCKLRDFNQPTLEDEDLFVYRTAVNRKLSDKVNATLYGARDLVLDTDITGQAGPGISANRDQTSVGGNLVWVRSPRMSLDATAGIIWGDRDARITQTDPETGQVRTGDRTDTTYHWGIHWRWARTRFDEYLIGYRYLDRHSDFKNYDYEDHQLSGAVQLSL